ncbi:MAG: hypothetical protein EOO56_14200 [Hymenobacter sp.]|nr:MAG: hypothetical protein EOO56_14200 [Hymenobacter sp.]
MPLLFLLYPLLGPPCSGYPTVADSDAWLTATRQLPLRQQLAAVRQRLACDARVRSHSPAAAICVSCLTAEGRRAHEAAQEKQRQAEAADPRPLGVVLFYIIDGQIVAPADTAHWQPLLTRQRVREITFWESQKALVMGGTRAQAGMVVISTKK